MNVVKFHLQIIQSTISPIIPPNALHGSIRESRRQQRTPKPRPGRSRTRHRRKGTGNKRLEPRSVRSNVRIVRLTLEDLHPVLTLVVGVEGGVAGAVERDAGEDEEEGVCYECGGGFGEAEGFLEVFGEEIL